MKTLVSTMAISILLANPVQAAQNHDHDDEKMQGNNASKKHDTASSGMKDMHRHMKKMKQAMVQIKGEKDPVIKKQLMKNHMAGINKTVNPKASNIPEPMNAPNTLTGGIGVRSNEKNPTADVSEVNSIGLNRCFITFASTSFTSSSLR